MTDVGRRASLTLFQSSEDAAADKLAGSEISTNASRRGTGSLIRPQTCRLPDGLSHYTFAELVAVRSAVFDTRSRDCWHPFEGEIGLWHQRPGARHYVRFTPSGQMADLALPIRQITLEWFLEQFGEDASDAVFTLQVAVAAALSQPTNTPIELGQFLRAIGWDPRSARERDHLLRKLWLWFTIWDGWSVHGERSGERYRDPRTGQLVETRIDDPLIRITGVRWGQRSLDDSTAPLVIYLAPGAFLERFRGSPQVLQYFGELRVLSGIPSGKASGEWAKCMGAALRQLWRQSAKNAEVAHVGEDGHLTVRGSRVTRRRILRGFPPTRHPVDRILADATHAPRARNYWDAAVRLLKNLGVVGYYRPIGHLPTECGGDQGTRMRDGWQDAWLDQPLDVRPGPEGTQAIAEIRRSTSRARKAKRRRARAQVTA